MPRFGRDTRAGTGDVIQYVMQAVEAMRGEGDGMGDGVNKPAQH